MLPTVCWNHIIAQTQHPCGVSLTALSVPTLVRFPVVHCCGTWLIFGWKLCCVYGILLCFTKYLGLIVCTSFSTVGHHERLTECRLVVKVQIFSEKLTMSWPKRSFYEIGDWLPLESSSKETDKRGSSTRPLFRATVWQWLPSYYYFLHVVGNLILVPYLHHRWRCSTFIHCRPCVCSMSYLPSLTLTIRYKINLKHYQVGSCRGLYEMCFNHEHTNYLLFSTPLKYHA